MFGKGPNKCCYVLCMYVCFVFVLFCFRQFLKFLKFLKTKFKPWDSQTVNENMLVIGKGLFSD